MGGGNLESALINRHENHAINAGPLTIINKKITGDILCD